MKTAEEYRARVIQLESLIARISLVTRLPDTDEELVRYVISTSIAMTEDYDTARRMSIPRQQVTPLESIILWSQQEFATIDGCLRNEDDRALPEDEAIKEAHPTRTGRHDLYAEAMRLVGAKRSKFALVALVNWLLHRCTTPRA